MSEPAFPTDKPGTNLDGIPSSYNRLLVSKSNTISSAVDEIRQLIKELDHPTTKKE